MAWHEYEEGRVQKDLLRRKLEKLRANGETFEPLSIPQGLKIAKTFWGHAWCRHLESLSDYENRLPRGRSYLRQGNVYNLVIEPGRVAAQVTGSSIYGVHIAIQPVSPENWANLKSDCAGQVASLLDLLGGKLGDAVLRAATHQERGLFPNSREIRVSCSCPDYADLCKHAAAVLYGVGFRLDARPELFFTLRSVDPSELLSSGVQTAIPETRADDALQGEDLGALFGIDLASETSAAAEITSLSARPDKLTHESSKLPQPSRKDSVTDAHKLRPQNDSAKEWKPRRKTAP